MDDHHLNYITKLGGSRKKYWCELLIMVREGGN